MLSVLFNDTVNCRDNIASVMSELAWNTGVIIVTEENRSNRETTCPSVSLITTSLIWTGLGSTPELRLHRLATDPLIHSPGPFVMLNLPVCVVTAGF